MRTTRWVRIPAALLVVASAVAVAPGAASARPGAAGGTGVGTGVGVGVGVGVEEQSASAAANAAEAARTVVVTTFDDEGRPHFGTVATAAAADADRLAADLGAAGVDAVVDAPVSAAVADPLRPLQWSLDATSYEAATARHAATGQIVAVIDSGVDPGHEDLGGVVLGGCTLVGSPNGACVGDGRTDPFGHGTAVAGVIASVTANGVGVTGTSRGASILPLRILDANGDGALSDLATAIVWATDHGAGVLNMSLGIVGLPAYPPVQAALDYANARRVVAVAAAGNEGAGSPAIFPAVANGVLAVAATAGGNQIAEFSSQGSWVGISAPGVGVLTLTGDNAYACENGTSISAPFVAAAAALVRGAAPTLSSSAIVALLRSTARPLGATNVYGAGLVEPDAAVAAAMGAPPPTTTPGSAAPPTVTLTGGPAVVQDTVGTHLFAQGADGGLWRRSETSFGMTWERLGGDVAAAPGAVAGPGARELHVFVRRTDGALWHRMMLNGRWIAWEPLGGQLRRGPAATLDAAGNVHVFVRGTDDALWHRWWTGRAWSGWESLGGKLSESPAATTASDGSIHVFVRGTDNALWHRWWNGSRWLGFEFHGGVLNGAPAAASGRYGDIHVFVRGTDAAAYHRWWSGAAWLGYEWLGGILATAPSAAAGPGAAFQLYSRADPITVAFREWTGSFWTTWTGDDLPLC